MINKRIIFSLLYADGFFHLSRNFRLQKVGNVEWIKNNYGFGETCNFIDELIITFVKRNPTFEDYIQYFDDINKLRKKIFVPIILGGRIMSFKNVKNCFLNGSDKVLINTLFYNDPGKITEFSNYYGKQAISLMVDYKIINEKDKLKFISYKNCGQDVGENIDEKFINKINNLPCGEVIFNSIDNDGNGSGINLDIVKLLANIKKPLLMMGGAGKPEHISKTLKLEKVSGVVTANLFNFLGTGLKKAREECFVSGIKLPIFDEEI